MFYTWGCLDASYVHTSHMFICPLGVYAPICPPYSSVHLYVLRGFCMLCEVVRGLLHVRHLLYTSPIGGCLPLCLPFSHSLAFLCISMLWGYLYVIWGIFPLCWDLGGVPICWGWLFLYILVVHYVSCFYYGYDYYSSS